MIRVREELAVFLLAVQLLTRWPIRTQDLCTEARLTASTRYYPLVGALVGAFAGGVFWLAHMVFPVMLAIVLATAASLLATGAFHEDGFADTCDGLGGGTTRERALEIMRDSRLGTYGVAGLGLMLAAKVLAIAAAPPEVIPWLLVAAHAASRSSAVLALATSAYVRGAGIATPVAGSTRPENLAIALATGTAAVCVLFAATDTGGRRRGARGARGRTPGHARAVRTQARRLYRGLSRGGAADQRAGNVPRHCGGDSDADMTRMSCRFAKRGYHDAGDCLGRSSPAAANQ